KIPFRIKNLTGITEEMLVNAPGMDEAGERLLSFLGDFPVVGHNIRFDLNFLNSSLVHGIKNPSLDTFELVQFLMPCAESYRLEALAETLKIAFVQSHRAPDDAETACRLFYCLQDIFLNINPEVLSQMHQLSEGEGSLLAGYITKLVRERLREFPAAAAKNPYAFLNTPDNTSDNLFASRYQDSADQTDILQLASVLEPSGALAVRNEQYKFRTGQVQMLNTVIRGFSENRHMVIEAGTGTGKSLAYLIPAVGWAVANQTKVVIATHTINLQEQLWNKEIPELKASGVLRFNAALVKGRNNYLCLRRWESKIKDFQAAGHNDLIFQLKLMVWLTETLTGDKSELNVNPSQGEFWKEICSDVDTCLGPSCRWFQGKCFVVRARRQADTADILVVNHSLLLADVKTQNRILPSYDYLVIDEAHHLEASATEQLGWAIGLTSLRSTIISLNRGFGSGTGPGIFNVLKKMFTSINEMFAPDDRARFNQMTDDSFEKVKYIVEAVDELYNFLKAWIVTGFKDSTEERFATIRIKDNHRMSADWAVFASLTDNIVSRTTALGNLLKKIGSLFEQISREQSGGLQAVLKDMDYLAGFLSETNSNLKSFAAGSGENVYWLEVSKGIREEIWMRSAPVTVSQLLYDGLFEAKKSVLLTSATLSVDGTFEHFMERTGLSLAPDEDIITSCISSPFAYERQSLLCVIKDLPEPSVSEGIFAEQMVPVIADLAKIFDGKMLVLFNSHKMLREVYFRLQAILEPEGINLLGHKIDGGRTRIINEFRQNSKTVLLGASSFWEGIDLPGEILKCVVVTRLPFSPPNTPVVEARMEELVNNNKDAFYSYAVPEAVIKLKQGFGRLIRTESDEGVVVVLDNRMVSRRYGRKFLNSLPLKSHIKGDYPTVLQKITDWISGERMEFPAFNIIDSIRDIDKFIRSRRK
ncbi:MAG TPA: helicase C-terminal domain-containing protein, partial [Desulfobacteria bacterium]|nr:helicase C-terminal domain-containing protein [Desulfobacteria bacterium]